MVSQFTGCAASRSAVRPATVAVDEPLAVPPLDTAATRQGQFMATAAELKGKNRFSYLPEQRGEIERTERVVARIIDAEDGHLTAARTEGAVIGLLAGAVVTLAGFVSAAAAERKDAERGYTEFRGINYLAAAVLGMMVLPLFTLVGWAVGDGRRADPANCVALNGEIGRHNQRVRSMTVPAIDTVAVRWEDPDELRWKEAELRAKVRRYFGHDTAFAFPGRKADSGADLIERAGNKRVRLGMLAGAAAGGLAAGLLTRSADPYSSKRLGKVLGGAMLGCLAGWRFASIGADKPTPPGRRPFRDLIDEYNGRAMMSAMADSMQTEK